MKSIVVYGNLPSTCVTDLLANRHSASLPNSLQYREYINHKLVSKYSNPAWLLSPSNTADESVANKVKNRLVDPYFMPLMCSDLSSHTDAYIVTAQHDVVRDDGILYATRLQNATGVRVEHQHYEEGFHNFFHYSEGPLKLELAHQALYNLIHFLRSNVIYDSFDK